MKECDSKGGINLEYVLRCRPIIDDGAGRSGRRARNVDVSAINNRNSQMFRIHRVVIAKLMTAVSDAT